MKNNGYHRKKRNLETILSPVDERVELEVLADNMAKLIVPVILKALNPRKVRKRTNNKEAETEEQQLSVVFDE